MTNDLKYPNPTTGQGVVNIHIAGIGGTGSILAHHVVRLDLAMQALGHPGFHIHLWDPDTVGRNNLGRQLFTEAEVGGNKAEMMAIKLQNNYRVRVTANACPLRHTYGIPIYCVDTKKARRTLHFYNHGWSFDCGNTANKGQVLMQHPDSPDTFAQFPDLTEGEEDTTPSCSLAESLGRQELFINSMVATACSQMLWQSFRHGGLDYRGAFINLNNNLEVKTYE